MSIMPHKKFIYVIAGGEGLKIIKHFEKVRDDAAKDLQDHVARLGGTVSFPGGLTEGQVHVKVKVSFPEGNTPADWSGTAGDAWPETGNMDARKKIIALDSAANLQEIFNAACMKLTDQHAHPLFDNYSYENLGGTYVIKCPESQNDKNVYFVPHGSTVITHEDYEALRQRVFQQPGTKIFEFPNKFTP